MLGLVSIGMPVFNDKQFLVPALEAVLAQSYSNFELIISDDGSTDGSEGICREYAARDPRVRYIRQRVNLGISRNMEFLLGEGTGDYFIWAADDDLWHRDFLKTLHDALQQNPAAVSAFTPMYFVDEQGNRVDQLVRAIDYSGSTASRRIRKLIDIFDDSFGYGLFRREAITGVRFPVWWWINKKMAYNNIYPTLCYYLAKGDFVLVGDTPMLFKRSKVGDNVSHKIPYPDGFLRGYFAFLLWKFNLVVVSLVEVGRAGERRAAFLLSPLMLFRWMIKPAARRFAYRGSLYWRGEISLF